MRVHAHTGENLVEEYFEEILGPGVTFCLPTNFYLEKMFRKRRENSILVMMTGSYLQRTAPLQSAVRGKDSCLFPVPRQKIGLCSLTDQTCASPIDRQVSELA